MLTLKVKVVLSTLVPYYLGPEQRIRPSKPFHDRVIVKYGPYCEKMDLVFGSCS